MKNLYLTIFALLSGFVSANATILLWHPDLGNAPEDHIYISSDAQTYEIYTTDGVEPVMNTEPIRILFNQQLRDADVTWLTVKDIRSDADTQYTIVLSVSANTANYTRSVFFGTDNRRLELTQRTISDNGVSLGIPENNSILPGSSFDVPLTGSNAGVIYKLMKSDGGSGTVIATLTGTGYPIAFSGLYLEPGNYWVDNVNNSSFTITYLSAFQLFFNTDEYDCQLNPNGEEYRLYFDYILDEGGAATRVTSSDDLYIFEGVFTDYNSGNSLYWDNRFMLSYGYDEDRDSGYISVTCAPNMGDEEIFCNSYLREELGNYIVFTQPGGGVVEEKNVAYTTSGNKLYATIPNSQFKVTYQLYKDDRIVATALGTGADLFLSRDVGTGEYHVEAVFSGSVVKMNSVSVVGNEFIAMSAERNWILSTTYIGDGKAVSDAVYFDGLGYPRQTVSIAAGHQGNSAAGDIVRQTEYDSWHRETKGYLPYFSENNQGRYVENFAKNQDSFYKNKFGVSANYSFCAYSENTYDRNPLDRQLSMCAPGHIFRTEERKKRFNYDYNGTNRVLRIDVKNNDSIVVNGYYSPDQLFRNEIIDEDSIRAITYTDKTGRTILQTNYDNPSPGEEDTDTYFVYDDRDRLAWVISPKGAAELTNGSGYGPNSDLARKYCYVYTYDKRGRVAKKRLPGQEEHLMVYDNGDRLVMQQDGNMRNESKWHSYEYDILGRLISEYFITTSDSREELQALFDDNPQNPPVYNICADATLIAEYKYDNYSAPTNLEFQDVANVTTDTTGRTLRDNRTTGLKVAETLGIIKSDNTWCYLNRAFYYDYRGQVIQIVESDPFGGLLRTSMQYDFTGNVLTRHEQFTSSGINDVFVTKYTYDNRGRLKQERATLNDRQSALVTYNYDELGRLVGKRYGAGSAAVNETMEYNLQGWLTRKNSGLLDLQLRYYDPEYGNAKYTGTIAELGWTHKKLNGNNDGLPQTYVFDYDRLNRLTSTDHYESGNLTPKFNETGYSYDRNGNMLGFSRTSDDDIPEQFSFIYDGNRRKLGRAHYECYEYDSNGNMIVDPENSVEIRYNFLNLPREVGASEASYRATYLADGAKFSVGDYENWGQTYRGSFIYNHEYSSLVTLESASFSSGRIWNGEVFYFLTDHLGSNRVVVNADTGQDKERNDYYPFGYRWSDRQMPYSYNRYGYNGKEIMSFSEFSYLDYGGRAYDPYTCVWPSIDPLAEKYYSASPYAYCSNNPINAFDPNGKLVVFINGFHFGSGASGYPMPRRKDNGNNWQGTREYWASSDNFDIKVMDRLKDRNAIYRDGRVGIGGPYTTASGRYKAGYEQGALDAEKIIGGLARNEQGDIVETIKIITHSMGAAYGKGYLEALLFYINEMGINNNIIEFEADFAPYQPDQQQADYRVPTFQFSHRKDGVAGNKGMQGAYKIDTNSDPKQTHALSSFIRQIQSLPQGQYVVVDGKIVPIE